MISTVDLAKAFAVIDEYWCPKTLGEFNGQFVKVAKIFGEYHWHSHANEDEMFLVVKGEMKILFRDRQIQVPVGSFAIVPRGVEHKPIADKVCQILLFESKTAIETGS